MHHPFAVTDRAIPNPFASGGVAAEKLNPVIFMKIIKKVYENFIRNYENYILMILRKLLDFL